MKLKDLRPGDIIVSKKTAPWYRPDKHLFQWLIREHSLDIYGKECIFPDADHVRIVCGNILETKWVFHWTKPTATFDPAKDWMLDPDYAMIFRHKHAWQPTGVWLNNALPDCGSIYDFGQLLDMAMGFKRFFDFGRKLYVCSVGARVLSEAVLEAPSLFPEVDVQKTPPCSWANSDMFECVNSSGKVAPIQTEPL